MPNSLWRFKLIVRSASSPFGSESRSGAGSRPHCSCCGLGRADSQRGLVPGERPDLLLTFSIESRVTAPSKRLSKTLPAGTGRPGGDRQQDGEEGRKIVSAFVLRLHKRNRGRKVLGAHAALRRYLSPFETTPARRSAGRRPPKWARLADVPIPDEGGDSDAASPATRGPRPGDRLEPEPPARPPSSPRTNG